MMVASKLHPATEIQAHSWSAVPPMKSRVSAFEKQLFSEPQIQQIVAEHIQSVAGVRAKGFSERGQ